MRCLNPIVLVHEEEVIWILGGLGFDVPVEVIDENVLGFKVILEKIVVVLESTRVYHF